MYANALFIRGKKSFIFYTPILWAIDACDAVLHVASSHVVGIKIFAIFLALPRFTVISLTCQTETAERQTTEGVTERYED